MDFRVSFFTVNTPHCVTGSGCAHLATVAVDLVVFGWLISAGFGSVLGVAVLYRDHAAFPFDPRGVGRGFGLKVEL